MCTPAPGRVCRVDHRCVLRCFLRGDRQLRCDATALCAHSNKCVESDSWRLTEQASSLTNININCWEPRAQLPGTRERGGQAHSAHGIHAAVYTVYARHHDSSDCSRLALLAASSHNHHPRARHRDKIVTNCHELIAFRTSRA